MERYKRKFKESIEKIPYTVYGKGNLNDFIKYFLKLYNKKFHVFINIDDININFSEIKNKSVDNVNNIFQKDIKKYFNVSIQNKESYNYLYEGKLLVFTDFSGDKIVSYVSWDVIEKSPVGSSENVTFIFE